MNFNSFSASTLFVGGRKGNWPVKMAQSDCWNIAAVKPGTDSHSGMCLTLSARPTVAELTSQIWPIQNVC